MGYPLALLEKGLSLVGLVHLNSTQTNAGLFFVSVDGPWSSRAKGLQENLGSKSSGNTYVRALCSQWLRGRPSSERKR